MLAKRIEKTTVALHVHFVLEVLMKIGIVKHMNAEYILDKQDCHICKKPNDSNQNLQVHLTSHRNTEPNFPCSECGKLFKAKHLLKAHIKFVH